MDYSSAAFSHISLQGHNQPHSQCHQVGASEIRQYSEHQLCVYCYGESISLLYSLCV